MAHFHRDFFSKRFLVTLAVLGAAALSLAINLSQIQRDLPFDIQPDEEVFSGAPLRIVSSGNLNPGWFGHPGSTYIYPLALIYHVYGVVVHEVPLFQGDHFFRDQYYSIRTDIILLGRFLSTLYAVLSIPLIYLLGKRVFGVQTAVMATWLGALAIGDYGQIMRTDTVGVFFSLLALLSLVRTAEAPTRRNYILSGIALGLAVATRSLLVGFAPLIFFLHTLPNRQPTPRPWRSISFAILAAAVTFVATTPFMFLDWQNALTTLQIEMRDYHSGADGLSFGGNFLWYLTRGLPFGVGWPALIFALLGLRVELRKERPAVLLLGAAIFMYMVAISLPALHWQRWSVQILPVILLFSVSGAVWLVQKVSLPKTVRRSVLTLACGVLLVVPPVDALWRRAIVAERVSTRTLMREWILQNIPNGSGIIATFYAPGLGGFDYDVRLLPISYLEEIEKYQAEDISYIILNLNEIQAYAAEPEVYKKELSIINRIRDRARLLKVFEDNRACPLPIVDHFTGCSSPMLALYEIAPAP